MLESFLIPINSEKGKAYQVPFPALIPGLMVFKGLGHRHSEHKTAFVCTSEFFVIVKVSENI